MIIACTDNLTGFSAAIEAVFPKTEIQNCIIHQLCNSSKYVSYKDLKELMADLKEVYAAPDEGFATAASVLPYRWESLLLRALCFWALYRIWKKASSLL